MGRLQRVREQSILPVVRKSSRGQNIEEIATKRGSGRAVDDLSLASDGLQFEVLASSLRADLTDTSLFLSALAEKLGGALPQQCVVERRGGLFAREKPISRVSVELGEYRYVIEKA